MIRVKCLSCPFQTDSVGLDMAEAVENKHDTATGHRGFVERPS